LSAPEFAGFSPLFTVEKKNSDDMKKGSRGRNRTVPGATFQAAFCPYGRHKIYQSLTGNLGMMLKFIRMLIYNHL